jgi:hypothetical protein
LRLLSSPAGSNVSIAHSAAQLVGWWRHGARSCCSLETARTLTALLSQDTLLLLLLLHCSSCALCGVTGSTILHPLLLCQCRQLLLNPTQPLPQVMQLGIKTRLTSCSCIAAWPGCLAYSLTSPLLLLLLLELLMAQGDSLSSLTCTVLRLLLHSSISQGIHMEHEYGGVHGIRPTHSHHGRGAPAA